MYAQFSPDCRPKANLNSKVLDFRKLGGQLPVMSGNLRCTLSLFFGAEAD